MDHLRTWTHCFLTHVPLGKLSSFKHDAGADTCWCGNYQCPQFLRCRGCRAACLEVRGGISVRHTPVGGSQQCPLVSRAQCMASLVSAAVLSFPEHAQTSRVFESEWSGASPCVVLQSLFPSVLSILLPSLIFDPWPFLCNQSSVWFLSFLVPFGFHLTSLISSLY